MTAFPPSLTVVLHDVICGAGGQALVQIEQLEMAGPGWVGIIGANGSGKTTLLRVWVAAFPCYRVVFSSTEKRMRHPVARWRSGLDSCQTQRASRLI